ncbi:hypothetical protein GQ53DRAFT_889362 [Thozetella sp. PMI_491]|nr:hypothetical protein GQ53DRAFT_889362 [Thozetella sp. PMI_491]
MSGRPRKACQQCSSLKVRCTGDKPVCRRCARLHRPCTWKTVSKPSPRSSSILETPQSTSTPTLGNGRYAGISPAMLSVLVDLYFTHMYNAALLIHRPSFTRALTQGVAKPHVVLSLCAVASIFYDSSDDEESLRNNGTFLSWAEQAGKLVFAEIDTPTEDNLVSFVHLSFFWYSQGQWQRMLVYEGNSGCTARILGLPATIRASDNSLAAEMTCRRFWACYIFNQFVSQPSFSKMVLSSLMKVPLPCDEIDFDRGVFPKERRTIAGVPGGSSFYRELIKLADLWNSVYLFIRDSDLGGSQKLLRIQTLDDQLRAWRRDLHETFELTPGILNAASRSVISQITLLHIGYHQSMCVLHSSIVPLFSLNPTGHDNAYAQKISAQTALEHARHVSAVFRDYLSPSGCTKQASGFVGYAAYCSCAIQLPFLGCTKPEVSLAARANIKLNYEIMGIIGHQWKIIKVLVSRYPTRRSNFSIERWLPRSDTSHILESISPSFAKIPYRQCIPFAGRAMPAVFRRAE